MIGRGVLPKRAEASGADRDPAWRAPPSHLESGADCLQFPAACLAKAFKVGVPHMVSTSMRVSPHSAMNSQSRVSCLPISIWVQARRLCVFWVIAGIAIVAVLRPANPLPAQGHRLDPNVERHDDGVPNHPGDLSRDHLAVGERNRCTDSAGLVPYVRVGSLPAPRALSRLCSPAGWRGEP